MEITVEENNNIRIDKYLSENTTYSRTKIIELIKNHEVLVNKKIIKPSYIVSPGDKITLNPSITYDDNIKEEHIDLDILYEDDYIIVVNKPSGMVVHPGSGNYEHTLANALLGHTKALSHENGQSRPGIVHRIDKDTSGVLLVAKNDLVHRVLADGFKNKTIKRVYIALLKGVLPSDTATIDAPIGRDINNRTKYTVTSKNSKSAITHLKVIKRFKNYTLVEVRLETGRTHQIRVHMKYIGHPVYNDSVYTNDKTTSFGQFLHAKSLEFIHPVTKEKMYFESPLPKEFQDFLNTLE